MKSVLIFNNFDVADFDGKKKIVLGTTSWVGGQDRVVTWAENQIVLVAKLRSHFQNQIAIAKNCDFLILNFKSHSKT